MPEPESLATLNEDWQRSKRLRRQGHAGELMSKMQSRETWWEATRPAWTDAPQPDRFTLGALAAAAGVPYTFAQEAVAEELVRPDAGRQSRTKRYRKRLASWLRKLYHLRSEGMAWTEIRAWSRRRFQPGHDVERQLPLQRTPDFRQNGASNSYVSD